MRDQREELSDIMLLLCWILFCTVLSQCHLDDKENSKPSSSLALSTETNPMKIDEGKAATKPEEVEGSSTSTRHLQGQNVPKKVKSRGVIWFSAFFMFLQLYLLLKLGSKLNRIGHEDPKFAWSLTPLVLFLPTIFTLMSVGKVSEALEVVELHQRQTGERGERYILTSDLMLSTILLLVFPWAQLAWVIVWNQIAWMMRTGQETITT